MKVMLIVIASQLASGNVRWFKQEYDTPQQCQDAKSSVVSHTHRTWRFCV